MIDGMPPELRALGEGLPAELRAATESILLARFNFARQAGMTFGGARDLYDTLGYDRQITTQQYRDRYARGGIAARAVDALPKAVWRGEGELVEDADPKNKTQFEREWFEMNDRLKVWSTFQRVHILSLLSSFSVLLIGAPGELNTELPRGAPNKLLYLTPFGGGLANDMRGQMMSIGQSTSVGDATIAAWEADSKNPRFGQPAMYQLRRTQVASPDFTKQVHWSRIVHVPAEGFLDDAVFGPPALEGVWNYFDDLEKVVGGGAEAFWLRANAGVHMDLDKDMEWSSPAARDEQIAAMKVKADEYRHQLTRWLQTRGVKVTQLGSDVANFKDSADAIITLIAGTRGIPKRILTGSEMGQLASTQDRDNWNDIVKDCRTSYASPVILRQFIDRLIAYGYISKPTQYAARWPDVAALTEEERAAGAAKWTDVNSKQGETVFTSDEIRDKWYSLLPLDEKDRRQWDKVRQADQMSINEKRTAVGLAPYEGDDEVDHQADIPFGLLPRETLRITDPSVPSNVPGAPATGTVSATAPALSAAEQKMIDQLEGSLKEGGVVNIVVRR